jgi:hypothetical protein
MQLLLEWEAYNWKVKSSGLVHNSPGFTSLQNMNNKNKNVPNLQNHLRHQLDEA